MNECSALIKAVLFYFLIFAKSDHKLLTLVAEFEQVFQRYSHSSRAAVSPHLQKHKSLLFKELGNISSSAIGSIAVTLQPEEYAYLRTRVVKHCL